MDMINTILIFLLTISIIVTFHEFGHYIAARLCGVKVLEFSVGFGKRLFGKKIGYDKTDYKICALPLGGYVKMLDEREGSVPEHEKNKAFNNQSLLKKTIIVSAGPLFNFILAVFFYFLVFSGGHSGFKPYIGTIEKNSIAENIGMVEKDIFYSINGKEVKTWSEVTLQIIKASSNEKNINIEVLRNKKIILLNTINFSEINFDDNNILGQLGVFNFTNQTMEIGFIQKGSPAEKSGLLMHDKIMSINNAKVSNWNEIVLKIKSNPDKLLILNILRNDKEEKISVKTTHHIKNNLKIGRLGIGPYIDKNDILSNKIFIKYGLIESLKLSFMKTFDFTLLTYNFIFKLVKGEASSNSISGPVGIAGYAADSFNNGYASFLGLLAMLSISIGVLNLLPIPMLDGGHLMYYLIEFIFRRPIPENVQLIFQQFGIIFLIILSFFALYNDLLRIMQ